MQLAYVDLDQRRQVASTEALLAVLRALGHDISRPDDAPKLLKAVRASRAQRLCEPVLVAWDGRLSAFSLCVERRLVSHPMKCVFTLEDGAVIEDVPTVIRTRKASERKHRILDCTMRRTLPIGVHQFHVAIGERSATSTVLAAPRRCFRHADNDGTRQSELGVFLPTYAIQSERNCGAGDLGDLRALSQWACRNGAHCVGTLPMLASFLDEPFEPSPYSPVSRLFWNAFFIDLHAAIKEEQCPEAASLLSSSQRNIEALRQQRFVDYQGVMRIKRRVLETLADTAFSNERRKNEIDAWLESADGPDAADYARFRAMVEKSKATWQHWPVDARTGTITERDYDSSAWRYHVYCQFVLHRQLSALARELQSEQCELYLDLPVGVNGGGYDVWRYRDYFALDLDAGAPPDPFFTHGQNWGFPVIDPQRSREQAHAYFQSVIRNHLQYTGLLRIDHVMGLHRIFCIPKEMSNDQGVYVRYPADELYAILSLESHRNQARLIGENLGTVPPEVNEAMHERGLYEMSIAQFSFSTDPSSELPEPRANELAALNTHDMPTFAAFWEGSDITRHVNLGLLSADEARSESAERGHLREAVRQALAKRGLLKSNEVGIDEIRDALLKYLAQSDAAFTLINLEDLWLEQQPQNMPGISTEQFASWRRKAARTLCEIESDHHLTQLLHSLAEIRQSTTRVDHAPTLPNGAGRGSFVSSAKQDAPE